MSEKFHLTREHSAKLLRTMMLIRRFEERCAELYGEQKIRGFLLDYRLAGIFEHGAGIDVDCRVVGRAGCGDRKSVV